MSNPVNPKQALFLWKLITAETAEEREPQQSRTRPSLAPKERKALVDQGFLTVEKRGRASHLLLNDNAWAWASTTMNVELMKSASAVGAEALQGLLRRLLPFLEENDLALASLFASKTTNTQTPRAAARSTPNSDRNVELPETIEHACLSLAGGARKQRVRLSALRKQLQSVPRATLDATLLDMQDAGRLVLYRDDNAAALTEDDHKAALIVGDAPRHLVYLEA